MPSLKRNHKTSIKTYYVAHLKSYAVATLKSTPRPRIAKLGHEVRGVFEMVGATCSLAENVSSKVRELDLIKVARMSFTHDIIY